MKYPPHDLTEVSKWYGGEIGVVQSPYGKLRIVLGTETGVMFQQLAEGEVFVVHTHPVMVTKAEHFQVDLAAAGKHVEAVVDWSGQVTYFSKAGIKNPVRPNGIVEVAHGYQAAFMNGNGAIVGFAKIDIFETPTGTTIKVRE